MSTSLVNAAIQVVQESELSFTKFITANDAGTTGAHQAGYHIPKNAWRLFFDSPGVKGTNKDAFVTIKWQDDFETASRAIYYGSGTRNEYRLTRFGKNFPFLSDSNSGDLLVITKISSTFYKAFVLHSDEDIDEFLAALNISTSEINGLVPKQFEQTAEHELLDCFENFIKSSGSEFPPTLEVAERARSCYNRAFKITDQLIIKNPDKEILGWLNAEFQLFKGIENDRYSKRIQSAFLSVEELVETANTILNRRKSRAGKSLEHHLSEVFKIFELQFENQALTEDKKKPDFLFPSGIAYKNLNFDKNKLIVLASKTTCKDRWRQILTEADRVKTKHLFTLQQGISKNQLQEMYKQGVCLVVPKPYLSSFSKEFQSKILTLDKFVNIVKQTQSY